MQEHNIIIVYYNYVIIMLVLNDFHKTTSCMDVIQEGCLTTASSININHARIVKLTQTFLQLKNSQVPKKNSITLFDTLKTENLYSSCSITQHLN